MAEAGARLPVGERILLTGATGQVGTELKGTLASLGEVVAPARSQMDLADVESVRAAIREVKPRWIVNPAAYTAVDKAEGERALAFTINADAVGAIGEEARKVGAGVLHFSTDYVFDGAANRPYVETDATAPLGVYGESKLAGEVALHASGAGHMIFRTSWVYGAQGKNFLLTILKLAREREQIRVVADQHGAPTWSRDLARLAAHVIGQTEAAADGRTPDHVLRSTGGVFHAPGRGETTWYGFAAEAIRLCREREPGTRFAEVEPIPSSAYPTPARRPASSRMDGTKLSEQVGWRMMEWQESLAQVLSEL